MTKTYKALVEDLGNQIADCLEWTRHQGQALNKIYLALGISRASHVLYCEKDEATPEYIRMHLDTLSAMPGYIRTELLLRRIYQDGYQATSLDRLTDKLLKNWELATNKLIADHGFTQGDEWTPAKAAKSLHSKLKHPDGKSLALLSIYNDLNHLSKHVKDKGNDANLQALGKIKFLLKQKIVAELVNVHRNQLVDLISMFREPTQTDWLTINGLDTKELEDAQADFDSMKKLQLTDGHISDEKPVFSKLVFAFVSVDAFYRNAMSLPHGFSLCCIKKPNLADSYFVLVTRNGERINVLTDNPDYCDPLRASRMAQRNNRYNERRQSQAYLPYELLNIHWEDKGRSFSVSSGRTDLTIGNDLGFTVIGDITSLNTSQLIWLGRMFDLCYERYFTASYEDNRVAIPYMSKLLIGNALQNELETLPTAISSAPVIALPSSSELTADVFNEYFPECASRANINSLLEKKYKPKIANNMLYICNKDDLLRIGDTSSYDNSNTPALHTLDKLDILDEQSFKRSAVYLARQNQATLIKALADKDFQERGASIRKKIYKLIVNNLPNLVDDLIAINHSQFYLPSHLKLVRQVHFRRIDKNFISSKDSANTLIKMLDLYANKMAMCYLGQLEGENAEADHVFQLRIDNVFDLVNITGVCREELPEELYNYGLKQVTANTILDTHDPVSLIKNPWNDLSFTFSLPVSREAVQKRRKERGLKRLIGAVANYWDYSSSSEAKALYKYLHSTPLESTAENDTGIGLGLPDSALGRIFLDTHKPDFYHYLITEKY